MDIQWDAEKEKWLLQHRGISIREIVLAILRDPRPQILVNPSRPNQWIFLVWYKRYIHVVPFVLDDQDHIVIKTAYPSRKFNRQYGAIHESEEETYPQRGRARD